MLEKDDSGLSGLLRRARAVITTRIQYMVRLAKRRKGSILAVMVLSILAAIVLYWARDTDQYEGNLLLNIGANLIGAVVAYALINPLMSRAASREEKVLDHFDHANVIERINDSKNIVRIFETGVELLDGPHLGSFRTACRAALKGGVRVEILVLDPDCRAAVQRAEELGSSLDIRSLILKNLRDFRNLPEKLDPDVKLNFEVRVYATAPLAAYYRWDKRALISFFPPTGRRWIPRSTRPRWTRTSRSSSSSASTSPGRHRAPTPWSSTSRCRSRSCRTARSRGRCPATGWS